MKALRNFFEKTQPYVQKGAKYHWLHSTHDAFFTLAFSPKHTAKSGSHIHDNIDMKRTMSFVIIALIPALLVGMYNLRSGESQTISENGVQIPDNAIRLATLTLTSE